METNKNKDRQMRRLENRDRRKRGKGRPRNTLTNALRKDMRYLELTENLAQNLVQCRSKIYIADPSRISLCCCRSPPH